MDALPLAEQRTDECARGGRAGAWLVALGLAALVLALYAPTRGFEYVSFDDGSYVTENPHVRGGLSLANLRWAFTDFHSANWHPLTWLTHMLDVQLFGLAPGPAHLVNAGLHALNALLCFLFLRRASGAFLASALCAFLFAVHPLRVESVAWIAERKDVLAGTFFFLTLLAYERYARAPSRARYGVVLLAFALGLLAKPMLVSVPFVLLLVDVWPLGRWRLGADFVSTATTPSLAPTHPGDAPARPGSRHSGFTFFREKLALFALAAASCVVTLLAQRAGNAVRSIEALPIDARLATAVLGTLAYLSKTFWPSGLAFFYPHPAFVARAEFKPFGLAVSLGALALVALTLLAWRLRRRLPVLLVGWLWMLVMLLPVIGIVQVGAQLHADRYSYLPTLGLVLACVFGLRELHLARALRRTLLGLGCAAGVACAWLSARQIETWRNTTALCTQALRVTERNYVAHEHLGLALQKQGDLGGARAQYEAALAIAPELPSSRSDLGAVLAQLGEREAALAEFQETLRRAPDFLDARLSWGFLLEQGEDLEGAREQFGLATRQHPESAEAWARLASVELGLRHAPAAERAYRTSLELGGDSADLRAGLGWARVEQEDEPGAEPEFAAALRLDAGSIRALHGAAWIRATSTRPGERAPARALELLQSCAARDGQSWQHLRVQAAALAALGRFADAVRTADEAWAKAPRSEWERLKTERASYQAAKEGAH